MFEPLPSGSRERSTARYLGLDDQPVVRGTNGECLGCGLYPVAVASIGYLGWIVGFENRSGDLASSEEAMGIVVWALAAVLLAALWNIKFAHKSEFLSWTFVSWMLLALAAMAGYFIGQSGVPYRPGQ